MEIVVTGDLLRPNPDGTPNQQSNIRWFNHMISYQLSRPLDKVPVIPLYPGKGEGFFDVDLFFGLNGLDVSVDSWARLYGAREVSTEAKSYFHSFFAHKFVVGFELPRLFIRLLEEAGCNYIDFIIHPIRFLDDVFFGVRTNNDKVRDLLHHASIPEERFHVQAGLHKATLSRLPSMAIKDNACLLVGQTAADRSLISCGRIVALDNFEEEIVYRFKHYEKIYFKPHPYASDAYEDFKFLSRFGEVELIEDNIYRLLADERFGEVVSISSSVGIESPYFGRLSSFFLGEPARLHNGFSCKLEPECYFPVYDAFFDPSFWQKAFAPFCRVSDCPSVQLPRKTSRLRTSFQNHWGYNYLDYEILFENVNQGQRKQYDFLWINDFSIDDFIKWDDIDFVRKAYLGILKRDPDWEGLSMYLQRLRGGELGKESILARLRFSREGMERGVRIRGLVPRLIRNIPMSAMHFFRSGFKGIDS